MANKFTALRGTLQLALCVWVGAAAACNGAAPIKVGLGDRGYASYRTASGYGGIAVDILDELSRRTGCAVTYVWLPSIRLPLELTGGRIDIGSHMLHDPHRDRVARFLPYSYSQNHLVIVNRSASRYTSLAQFTAQGDTTLNRVRGFLLSEEIERQLEPMNTSGRIETVNDFATLFNKMAAGRVSAAIMSPWIYLWHVRGHDLQRDISLLPVEASPPPMIGIYLSPVTLSAETGAVIARALAAMVSDGSIKEIYARYLPEPVARQLSAIGTARISAYLAASRQAREQSGANVKR